MEFVDQSYVCPSLDSRTWIEVYGKREEIDGKPVWVRQEIREVFDSLHASGNYIGVHWDGGRSAETYYFVHDVDAERFFESEYIEREKQLESLLLGDETQYVELRGFHHIELYRDDEVADVKEGSDPYRPPSIDPSELSDIEDIL
jgi:hypothetical protein